MFRATARFCGRKYRQFPKSRLHGRPHTSRWMGQHIFLASAAFSGALFGAHCAMQRIEDDDLLPEVTMADVAKHNKPTDAWVVIDGYAYDVTSWQEAHPGGSAVLRAHAGRDVSAQYRYLNHTGTADAVRRGLLVARVADYTKPAPLSVQDPPRQTDKKKRVIVVGAGICGVSAAYHLAERGYDVVVLEKSCMVGGTALRSTAIMFMGPMIEKSDIARSESEWLNARALELMDEISSWGEETGFRPRGALGLCATDEEYAHATKMTSQGGRLAGTGELIPPEKLRQIEPALSPELKGGVLIPSGGTCDPYSVCSAYARRAMVHGAHFIHGAEVTNLTRKYGDGFLVTCIGEDGVSSTLDTDVVVVATGWLSPAIAGTLGHAENVPVIGLHGQMFATKKEGVNLNHNLFGFESSREWARRHMPLAVTMEPDGTRITRHFYGVQISNGVLKFGGDRVQTFLDGDVLHDGILSTHEHVGELIPALKDCDISGSWSGMLPFTPDNKPIISELEPGLFVVTGPGVSKGGPCGQLLAEMVDGDKRHEHIRRKLDHSRFAMRKAAKKQESLGTA